MAKDNDTTVEGIDAALNELVRAADLSKALGGVAVENGGHTDERGSTSGGYPEQGDVGGLDSMMIGKMTQSLIDAGFGAGEIAAFMRGKQSDDEEEPDADDQGDGEVPELAGKFGKPADTSGGVAANPRVRPTGGKGGKMGKSLDALRDYVNERGETTIADAMDVSPFMADFATAYAQLFDGLEKSTEARDARTEALLSKMAIAAVATGQLVKSQQAVIAALGARLGVLESTPRPQRGLTGTARPLHKGMPGEAGGPARGGQPAQLTKSQVVSTLSYMGLEKSERWGTIGGQRATDIASLYESGGALPAAALDAVHRFLATNPGEAQTALSYR